MRAGTKMAGEPTSACLQGRRRLLAAAAAGLIAPTLGRAAAGRARVGVVPQFPSQTIAQTWGPLLAQLSSRLGVDFELVHFASIPLFERALQTGDLDVAYANPYHAVMARRWQGYEPILRDSSERLAGILVVARDGPIKTLADLGGGRKVAFPSPNAFGASLLVRAHLAELAKIDIVADYVGTHSNVYRQVAAGAAAAGGGVQRTLEREPAALRDRLKVLLTTGAHPSHPLIVHPRRLAELAPALKREFPAQDVPGRTELLRGVSMPVPRATEYAEYRTLEALGLEKYVIAAGG